MRLSKKTRQRSQAASTLYGHRENVPTTIQSIQSGPELRIQSRRLSRSNANDRNSIVSCDCSVSTLGDEFSHDGSSHVAALPESPVPIHQHRWKQISGGDLRDADLPPIGPTRSSGCSDDSINYLSGNDNTTSRRQRSIFSSEFEASEATDIYEDFSTNIRATKTAVEELIEDLRLEQSKSQPSDFIPKPIGRTPSSNLKSIETSDSGRRRMFGLPARLPSDDFLEKISPPTKERSLFMTGSREVLVKSADTPPSMAKRKSSQHLRDLCTDEYVEYDDDDDSHAITAQSENQRIPSDRPPELARRLNSPSPIHDNVGVSLDSSAIGLLDIEATSKQD